MNKLQDRLIKGCQTYDTKTNLMAFSVDSTLTAIHTDLMELCGEDEYDQQEKDETENGSEIPFAVRNDFRAELRKKIDEYCDKMV